jgi:ecdysteroid 25-hydroxylase
MNFILTGKEEQHKLYDAIIDDCERKMQDCNIDCRDSILKRFLLEKRDRENRHDELATNCSYEQLKHLLADIFGASLDTTACTLLWYFLHIAMYRDCQDKIYEEMINYGVKERYVLDDFENMPYFRATIAECQRLKAVVPCGIPHGNPHQHSTLAGYYIPQNSMVGECY